VQWMSTAQSLGRIEFAGRSRPTSRLWTKHPKKWDREVAVNHPVLASQALEVNPARATIPRRGNGAPSRRSAAADGT
jgi:hypothetical protein